MSQAAENGVSVPAQGRRGSSTVKERYSKKRQGRWIGCARAKMANEARHVVGDLGGLAEQEARPDARRESTSQAQLVERAYCGSNSRRAAGRCTLAPFGALYPGLSELSKQSPISRLQVKRADVKRSADCIVDFSAHAFMKTRKRRAWAAETRAHSLSRLVAFAPVNAGRTLTDGATDGNKTCGHQAQERATTLAAVIRHARNHLSERTRVRESSRRVERRSPEAKTTPEPCFDRSSLSRLSRAWWSHTRVAPPAPHVAVVPSSCSDQMNTHACDGNVRLGQGEE